jgi:uncharacterized protein DUF4262
MSMRGRSVADPADQQWIDLVARHGHAVMRVSDAVDQPTGEPGFAYSTGAYESYGAPELILFGLDGDTGAGIINDFMADYTSGRRFACGAPEHDLIAGEWPVVFLETSWELGRSYAAWTDWYYERQPFPLWQLFWPAKNGSFPWDAAYPADMIGLQPDLTGAAFRGHP